MLNELSKTYFSLSTRQFKIKHVAHIMGLLDKSDLTLGSVSSSIESGKYLPFLFLRIVLKSNEVIFVKVLCKMLHKCKILLQGILMLVGSPIVLVAPWKILWSFFFVIVYMFLEGGAGGGKVIV